MPDWVIVIVYYFFYNVSSILLLPIKDDRGRHRSFPYMTVGLVSINVTVHILFYIVFPLFIESFGEPGPPIQLLLRPIDVIEGKGLGALGMITAAFLHGSLGHLLSNMLLLSFFARKLEDVMGPLKFGLFYLVCVFVSSLGYVLGEMALPVTRGQMPMLGASGAVMGVVAAYVFLYHDQRIRTVIFGAWLFPPVPGFIRVPFHIPYLAWPRLPAWLFIVFNVLKDSMGAWLNQTLQQEYGVEFVVPVAWFVHLGGILAGLTCIYFFLPAEILHYRHRLGDKAES